MRPCNAFPVIPCRLPIDLAQFETAEVTVGTDTTFIFHTADGTAITVVGCGFRFEPRGRRLVAGTVRAIFVVDERTHTPIASLEGLSIDIAASIRAEALFEAVGA
ncbi:hypothetical protein [Acuticoccus sediminis]|uniref:hypothetical protein n=1 Tax=Acuticoccus sediminis TaxID=2184697 RepID=UPI001CFE91FD|nr:hypothetical protein [Acuticoccus sediminis]